MGRNYQDYIAFKRKVSAIERKLNDRGYQTEDNERECWLSVTRYRQQVQVAHLFIMEEDIDRIVTEVKGYLRYA